MILKSLSKLFYSTHPFLCVVLVDECALGLDDCDIDAVCMDLSDGFSCVCNEGFIGNGSICDGRFSSRCSVVAIL